MRTTRSTLFRNNRSQAVRLPKTVAFPDDIREVDIVKVGQGRLIVPRGKRWDDLFLAGPRASADFMNSREQFQTDERERR
jgi:antitoxin VapB